MEKETGKEAGTGRNMRLNMKQSRTTLKLTAVALGVVALLAAAAMAGVNRGEEMRASGISAGAPDTMPVHDVHSTAPKHPHRL